MSLFYVYPFHMCMINKKRKAIYNLSILLYHNKKECYFTHIITMVSKSVP